MTKFILGCKRKRYSLLGGGGPLPSSLPPAGDVEDPPGLDQHPRHRSCQRRATWIPDNCVEPATRPALVDKLPMECTMRKTEHSLV